MLVNIFLSFIAPAAYVVWPHEDVPFEDIFKMRHKILSENK